MRRLPGYTLRGTGGYAILCDPQGEVVRMPNGTPVKLSCSPRSDSGAVFSVLRQLRKAGVVA